MKYGLESVSVIATPLPVISLFIPLYGSFCPPVGVVVIPYMFFAFSKTLSLNEVFKKDNERSLELFDQLFSSSNIYDLLIKDPEAIRKFELADMEMQESFNKIEEYINNNGTDLEKEAFRVLKEFMENDEETSIKDSNKNIEELKNRLKKLVEKNNKNE